MKKIHIFTKALRKRNKAIFEQNEACKLVSILWCQGTIQGMYIVSILEMKINESMFKYNLELVIV